MIATRWVNGMDKVLAAHVPPPKVRNGKPPGRKAKTTDWFPGNVQPVHRGWYQVKVWTPFCQVTLKKYVYCWRFWTGNCWTFKSALGLTVTTLFDKDEWRGLRSKSSPSRHNETPRGTFDD